MRSFMPSPIYPVGLFHNDILPPESHVPYPCMNIERHKAAFKNSPVDSPLTRGIQAFPVEWPQPLWGAERTGDFMNAHSGKGNLACCLRQGVPIIDHPQEVTVREYRRRIRRQNSGYTILTIPEKIRLSGSPP